MRILLIITDLRGGGAQKVTVTLAAGLARRGHDVHLLLMQHLLEYEVPSGITLRVLTKQGSHMPSGWLGKRRMARKLRRWARAASGAGRFDIIIAGLPFASEIVWLSGMRPVWHHIHNSLSAEIDALAQNSSRKAHRRLARYRKLFEGGNLIAVSNGVSDDLRERIGLRRARIVTIYNPFDFEEIRRLSAAPEPDLPLRPYVMHAGRFARQKRHDLLLDAFAAAAIPHDLVLLASKSPELTALIEERRLSSRVTVAGFRSNPFPWYAHASALILSSDFEGFGNVLVEALACGTPVVSTDCRSGPREILAGPLSRYLSPCGDVQALAKNLRSAIETPPTIDRAQLDRFSLDRALDQVERLPR